MKQSLPPETYNNLYAKLYDIYHLAFAGIAINRQHLEQMTHDSLNKERSSEQLRLFEKISHESLSGKRILEIGAGVGLALTVANLRYGAEAFGIEPAETEYAGTLALAGDILEYHGLPRNSVQGGVGEKLPYPDNTFDAVISSNVIEHVQNPEQVIDESLRILKPGGILQFIIPNYGSWWEGHYGVLWLPNMPLWLGKLYVRLYGRDPSFLDTLRFINHSWLNRILNKHQDHIEILSWGQELWEERVRTLAFSEWSTLGKLKTIIRVIHTLGLVNLIIWVGKRLHWETPLVLTLRKLK